jgi:hypothetical protein
VIKAIEGISFEGLRGKFSIRALDHMGTVPCYQGTVAKSQVPFKIWKDISRVPGEEVVRPEASVREIWKKKGVTRETPESIKMTFPDGRLQLRVIDSRPRQVRER